MKRINQLLLFYLLVFSSAVFIQSCCQGSNAIVGSGEMYVQGESFVTMDTLDGPFIILVAPALDLAYEYHNKSLLNTANALSCDMPIVNRIDVSTVDFSFDKPIMLNEEEILPGTNLIGREGVRFEDGTYSGDLALIIRVDQSFMDNVVFDSDQYTLTVKMSTDNDVDIENAATVFVRP